MTEMRRRCLRPARILRYSCEGTCLASACVYVAAQDVPGLRIRPPSCRDLMEVGRRARMRRFRATSSGHELITDTSLRCAQRNGLEPIVCRRQVRVRVLARDCTTERPLPAMCGPLSLVCCMFAQLPIRDAAMCAAGLRPDDRRRWHARALRWGSCESDLIGRTAQTGFRLQLVVIARVRRARAPSLEARFRH